MFVWEYCQTAGQEEQSEKEAATREQDELIQGHRGESIRVVMRNKTQTMGYYFRYVTQTHVSINDIESNLKKTNNQYELQHSQINDYIDLLYQHKLIAHIEINRPEDDIFQEDINELIDTIGEPQNQAEQETLKQIHAANTLIAIEAIWEGANRDAALNKLDPLWAWLFQNHPGILQADGEGFYNANGLIIDRNFTL